MSNHEDGFSAVNAGAATLDKRLTAFDFFAIGFGAIIGVGWVISVGDWFGLGGGPLACAAAFVACMLLLLPIGKIYGDLAVRWPVAGGVFVYAGMAFGKRTGFITGWILALGYMALCPWEVIAIGQITESILPALKTLPLYTAGSYTVYLPTVIVNLIIAGAIVFVNFRGIDQVAKIQKFMVWLLIAIGAGTIVIALIKGTAHSDLFLIAPTAKNASGSFFSGFIAVLSITPFFYSGFDTIAQEAEEYGGKQSRKVIGRTVTGSLIASAIFYVLIIVAISFCMPWQDLIAFPVGSLAAFEVGLGLPLWSKLLLFGALCGLGTTLNSFFASSARVLFSMGREHALPSRFSAVHPRYRTPTAANVAVAVVTVAGSFLPRSMLLPIINVCSFCFVTAWLMASLASWKLSALCSLGIPRTKGSRLLHGAAALSGLLILLTLTLPSSSGALKWPQEWLIILLWIAAGIVINVIVDRPAQKLKAPLSTTTLNQK